MPELVRDAVAKTIEEKEALAVFKLKRYIAKSEDYKKIEGERMNYRNIDRKKREKLATDLR